MPILTRRSGPLRSSLMCGSLFALMFAASLTGCSSAKEDKPAPAAGGTTAAGKPGGPGTTTPETAATTPETPEKTTDAGKPAAAPAKPARASGPLGYVPRDAYAFILVRPARIVGSDIVKGLPESLTEKPLNEIAQNNPLSLDPLKIESVSVAVLPPGAGAAAKEGGAAGPADRPVVVLLKYTEPLELAKVVAEAKEQGAPITEQTAGDLKYFRLTKPANEVPREGNESEEDMSAGKHFAIVAIDDRTILGGDEAVALEAFKATAPGPIAERLKGVSLDQDLVVAVLPGLDEEMVQLGTMVGGSALPPSQQGKLMQTVGDTKSVLVSLDLTAGSLLSVTVEGNTPEAAGKFESSLQEGKKSLEGLYQLFSGAHRGDDAPAPHKELVGFTDKLVGGLAINRTGNDVTVAIKNPGGWDKVMATVKPMIEEQMKKSQAAAKQLGSVNNLKQIGLALHNFEAANGSLPPAKEAKGAGLSWRVHILPFLDQQELYSEFNLDEPWDSETNKALIEKMPAIFESAEPSEEKGKTRFLGFSGEGAIFGRETGLKFEEVKDGLALTILAVEAGPDKAIIWTKPEDLKFDPKEPKAALGELAGPTFPVLFADGSVRRLKVDIDDETLKAVITAAGEEDIDPTKLAP